MQPDGIVYSLHKSGDLALVGGSNGVVDVYSASQNQVQQSLKADSGVVTNALWIEDRAAVSTSKGKVLIFSPLSGDEPGLFDAHSGSVTAITVHPSGDLLASVGADRKYVLYDLQTMKVLTEVATDSSKCHRCCLLTIELTLAGVTCAHFHPDGHLLAVGSSDGKVRIFDVSSGSEAADINFPTALKKVIFSENGIWLACVSRDSTAIAIYDIRKITNGPVASLETGGVIDALDWDYTGQFLASAGPDGVTVSQYSKASKAWSELLKSANPATGVVWGKSAQSLLTSNLDGVVTLLSS